MNVVQVSRRFPFYTNDVDEGLLDHIKDGVKDRFGRELMDALAERGGIVGPIHEEVETRTDWLFGTDAKDMMYTVYASVTSLPEPEEYRMMGGPADGHIMRTGGQRMWRVPYLPPVTTKLFDISERVDLKFAEYEREGDTQVYMFRGIVR